VRSVKAIHACPPVRSTFPVFRIVEDYRGLASDRGVAIPSAYADAHAMAGRIETAFAKAPIPDTTCHNDLLNANFLRDGDHIWIGGGVAGTSIAYHLTELGWKDVLLLERSELTSGSTFHSAGLVGQLRSGVSLTRMMMYSVELYRRLTAETGTDPGWHEVGSLRLASSAERIEELQRLAGWGRTFDLPISIVSTEEALERFP